MNKSLCSFILFFISHNLNAQQFDWVEKHRAPLYDFLMPNIPIDFYPDPSNNPVDFYRMVHIFVEKYRHHPLNAIAAIEAKGFIFGAALAEQMHLPFIKMGKTEKNFRILENMNNERECRQITFEMERNGIHLGDYILLIDDLLATSQNKRDPVKNEMKE